MSKQSGSCAGQVIKLGQNKPPWLQLVVSDTDPQNVANVNNTDPEHHATLRTGTFGHESAHSCSIVRSGCLWG